MRKGDIKADLDQFSRTAWFDRLAWEQIEQLREIVGDGTLGWGSVIDKLTDEQSIKIGKVVFGRDVGPVRIDLVKSNYGGCLPRFTHLQRDDSEVSRANRLLAKIKKLLVNEHEAYKLWQELKRSDDSVGQTLVPRERMGTVKLGDHLFWAHDADAGRLFLYSAVRVLNALEAKRVQA